jgi:hypothetical protein
MNSNYLRIEMEVGASNEKVWNDTLKSLQKISECVFAPNKVSKKKPNKVYVVIAYKSTRPPQNVFELAKATYPELSNTNIAAKGLVRKDFKLTFRKGIVRQLDYYVENDLPTSNYRYIKLKGKGNVYLPSTKMNSPQKSLLNDIRGLSDDGKLSNLARGRADDFFAALKLFFKGKSEISDIQSIYQTLMVNQGITNYMKCWDALRVPKSRDVAALIIQDILKVEFNLIFQLNNSTLESFILNHLMETYKFCYDPWVKSFFYHYDGEIIRIVDGHIRNSLLNKLGSRYGDKIVSSNRSITASIIDSIILNEHYYLEKNETFNLYDFLIRSNSLYEPNVDYIREFCTLVNKSIDSPHFEYCFRVWYMSAVRQMKLASYSRDIYDNQINQGALCFCGKQSSGKSSLLGNLFDFKRVLPPIEGGNQCIINTSHIKGGQPEQKMENMMAKSPLVIFDDFTEYAFSKFYPSFKSLVTQRESNIRDLYKNASKVQRINSFVITTNEYSLAPIDERRIATFEVKHQFQDLLSTEFNYEGMFAQAWMECEDSKYYYTTETYEIFRKTSAPFSSNKMAQDKIFENYDYYPNAFDSNGHLTLNEQEKLNLPTLEEIKEVINPSGDRVVDREINSLFKVKLYEGTDRLLVLPMHARVDRFLLKRKASLPKPPVAMKNIVNNKTNLF